MATKNYKRGTTGAGYAFFPHLKKTETINGKDTGKYTLMLILGETDRNVLANEINGVWNEFLATPEMQGKKVRQDWNDGFREYKGDTFAKFTTSAQIKTRTGEVIPVTIPVFDGAGNPLNLDREIGNSSVVKVAYELYPYYMSSNVHGVSLRLRAVQVLDLKLTAQGTASSFGFSTNGPAITVPQQQQEAPVQQAPAPQQQALVPDDNPFGDMDDMPFFPENDGDF